MPPPLLLPKPGLDEPVRPTSLPPPPRSPSYRFFPAAGAPPVPTIPAGHGLPTPDATPASSVASSSSMSLARGERKQPSSSWLDQKPISRRSPVLTPPSASDKFVAPSISDKFSAPSVSSKASTSAASTSAASTSASTSTSSKSTRPVHDELDEIAYQYALRVAILNHRIKARSVRNASLPSIVNPISPLSGLKHSHSTSNLTTPAKIPLSLRHRYSSSTFLPLLQDETATSPVLPQREKERGVPLIGPVPSPTTLKKRRSRGLSLRILHHHSENRVPKYAVREFSQFLAANADKDLPGRSPSASPSGAGSSIDASWTDACNAYQSREKHCFSSRSVEDIVESFIASSPIHKRQAHSFRLLSTLYAFLPDSQHFHQATTEKDRDLLFRIRADIQRLVEQTEEDVTPKHSPQPSLSLRPRRSGGLTTGLPRSPTCSSLPASPTTQTRFPRSTSFVSTSTASAPSPSFPITPRTPHQTRSAQNLNSPSTTALYPSRKPPPSLVDDELIRIVGQLWDISPAQHQQNIRDIESRPLEKLYLDHLKLELSLNVSSMSLVADKKKRHHRLSKRVTDLVSNFPEIIGPGSSSPNNSLKGDYFTPKKKNGAFSRLLKRASTHSTNGSLHGPPSLDSPGVPSTVASPIAKVPESSSSSITGVAPAPNVNALVTQCEEMWEPETVEDKEAQVNEAFMAWTESIGQRGEVAAGEALANSVADLCDMLEDEDRPPILEVLFNRLFDLTAKSMASIFPSTGVPPPSPPPSILPLLRVHGELFIDSPEAKEAFRRISAEVYAAAVNEFNAVSTELIAHNYMLGTAGETADPVIENFERLAEWFEQEISNVAQSWRPSRCLPECNPAQIVISAQLPLFLGELKRLELPPGVEGSSDVFISLYEVTYRLLKTYEDLTGTETAFDLELYFEPHIQKWLRETEKSQNKDWIFRLVQTESWTLVNGQFTQGYLDFMGLVSNSLKVITASSLSPAKRALFLMDLSKTLAASLVLYAQVLAEKFEWQVVPPLSEDGTSIRSSAHLGGKDKWLQKGKLARDKLLDQKRRVVTPYVVEETACAKLLNVIAVQDEVPRLSSQMDADACAAALTNLQIEDGEDDRGRTYTVTIQAASGLFKRNGKAADAFISIYDRSTGERVLKTETVFGDANPRFNESIRVTLKPGENKLLEVQAHDRALVRQHNILGSKTLVINEHAEDTMLSLAPAGNVKVRVQKPFTEVNDIASNLSHAERALGRIEGDMRAALADRILDYPRWLLTPEYLANVVKASHLKRELSFDPIFKQLDANLGLLMEVKLLPVIVALWDGLLSVFAELLLPPLGEPTQGGIGLHGLVGGRDVGPGVLSESKTKQVFKWVADTKAFFNPDGQGVPLDALESPRYQTLMNIPRWNKVGTRELMDAVSADVRAFWQAPKPESSVSSAPPTPTKDNAPPPLPSRANKPALPPRPGSSAPPLPARKNSASLPTPPPPTSAPRVVSNGTATPHSPWSKDATSAPLSPEQAAGLKARIEVMLRILSLRQGTRGFVREHTVFLNRDAS